MHGYVTPQLYAIKRDIRVGQERVEHPEYAGYHLGALHALQRISKMT
jgi:hypothetical protein